MAPKSAPSLAPVGLYAGFFAPTEAGGAGAFGAMLIALALIAVFPWLATALVR